LALRTAVTSDQKVVLKECALGTQPDAKKGCPEVSKDRFKEYQALLKLGRTSGSATQSLWDALKGKTVGTYNRDNPLMQLHMADDVEFQTAGSMSTLNSKLYDNDYRFEGVEAVFAKGYSGIVDGLVSGVTDVAGGAGTKKPIPVSTNKRVSAVEKVGSKLKVSISDGTSLMADHVIFTGSAGVLKAKTVSFNPPLSKAKLDAVSQVGFGNVIKVGLLFEKRFWPENYHYFALAQPTGANLQQAERFSYILNLQPFTNRSVLFAFVFGSSAWELESWTDVQVWSAVRANLVQLFGKDTVPAAAKAIWRSSWGTNPNFRGSYSYMTPATPLCAFFALSQPEMGGGLHFAGEHTLGSARGTVHGAFLSGLRAASEVLATTRCTSSRIGSVNTKAAAVIHDDGDCAEKAAEAAEAADNVNPDDEPETLTTDLQAKSQAGTCMDLHTKCTQWAAACTSTKIGRLVRGTCARTCGLCSQGLPTGAMLLSAQLQ
jgi:hypothetical protein